VPFGSLVRSVLHAVAADVRRRNLTAFLTRIRFATSAATTETSCSTGSGSAPDLAGGTVERHRCANAKVSAASLDRVTHPDPQERKHCRSEDGFELHTSYSGKASRRTGRSVEKERAASICLLISLPLHCWTLPSTSSHLVNPAFCLLATARFILQTASLISLAAPVPKLFCAGFGREALTGTSDSHANRMNFTHPRPERVRVERPSSP
jgi:hypothetical protein